MLLLQAVGIRRLTLVQCVLLMLASCTNVPFLNGLADTAADGGGPEANSEPPGPSSPAEPSQALPERAQSAQAMTQADAAVQGPPPFAAAGTAAPAAASAAGGGANLAGAGAAGQTRPEPSANALDAAVVDAAVATLDATPPPECRENDGRCVTTLERQLCENGKWVTKSCDANTVCVPNALVPPGECTPVDPHCLGSESANACDSNGTLYMCDAYAVAYHTERCMSRAHCEAGKMFSRCSVCVIGEFKCEGTTTPSLLQCAPASSTGWAGATVCAPNLHCGPNDPKCTDAGL